jgi:hypothetical protein
MTRLVSGLGNQLFQWAVARALAEKHRTRVLLDLHAFKTQTFSYDAAFPRPFKLGNFRIKAAIATPAQVAAAPDFFQMNRYRRHAVTMLARLKLRPLVPRIREPSFSFHPEVLAAGDPVYLQGYWLSGKYFSAIAPIIREEARLVDETLWAHARRFVASHRRPGAPVVGVQVRRGDVHYLYTVLKKPELAPMPLVPRDYFMRAMRHFGDHCTFLLFSDSEKDLQLCREEFSDCKNIVYVAGNDDLADFAVLQQCDHQIISNSTFGWWAAWLNPKADKTVIAPREWYLPTSPHAATLSDLIPPGWTLL